MSESKDIFITILMVDLSGYTAMTEAHGGRSAAEIVARFSEIVQDALYKDSRLVECVGDGVLIVSPVAEDLIETTLEIR